MYRLNCQWLILHSVLIKMKTLASDEERIKRFYHENTADLEHRQWFIILVDSVVCYNEQNEIQDCVTLSTHMSNCEGFFSQAVIECHFVPRLCYST